MLECPNVGNLVSVIPVFEFDSSFCHSLFVIKEPMPSKRFRALAKEKPSEAVSLSEAVAFVKAHASVKFDETVELHVRLGIDPKKAGESVRGTVNLPHGGASAVRVAVFTNDAKLQAAAKGAGADIVGGPELVEQVQARGALDADVAVATPDAMKDLAGVAKILGPKGLMPNPKTGTIGPDPAAIVRELKKGRTSFKTDETGNVHLAVGKASWDQDKLVANFRAALESIRQARPASARGEFVRAVTVASTMGAGVRVQLT